VEMSALVIERPSPALNYPCGILLPHGQVS
jgi:hypothetical protein